MDEPTATPEENFNNDLWYVLKKIREKSLYTKYGEDIRYSVTFGFFGRPYNDAEIAMVKKLGEWKVIELTDPDGFESDGEHVFSFKTVSPRFPHLYNLFNNAMAKNISHDRLFQLTRELTHPTGTDQNLSFELWELSKKKTEENGSKKLKTLRGRLLPNIRNLYNFSDENRFRIKRFIQLIQNQDELQGHKSSILLTDVSLSLPVELLLREGFSLPEAELLIETIDKVADHSFIKTVRLRGRDRHLALEFDVRPKEPILQLNIALTSPSALQEIKEHLEAFEKRSPKTTEAIMPQPEIKAETRNHLSEADGKRLAILEKLKAEWDLTPKENTDPVIIYSGRASYRMTSGEIKVPAAEYSLWMEKFGINFDQFQRILEIFRQEGLIKNINFISEYR